MIRNYIIISIRNLWKNKTFSAINIIGLAVGLRMCMLVGLFIFNELSYDRFQKHANRIVRVTMEFVAAGTVNKTAVTGSGTGHKIFNEENIL